MSVTLEWLRAEAARQGLPLDDEDLRAIRDLLEKTKSALAVVRPADTENLLPPYTFPPRE
ncbi:MAG: hypothetical protein HY660_01310 [Armatimonadetes bacterium]|nr:hypothetical protein [Armatimonadota bacterium]